MMKRIKYITGLLILFAVSCSTPLTEEQKNSDSVLLQQTHEYILNEDGSIDYNYYHRRMYNSYMSFNRLYGETFVVFNPEYQTLNVSKSQTTMADGKKVDSPQNAFNEVLPFSAADAPAYNHLREMVITHVGLEIGCVVELNYSIHTKAGFLPLFGGKLMLNESSPIKDLKVVVKVPKGQELKYFINNQSPEINFTKLSSGEFDIYTWTAINLPARSNESHQVEGFADYQTLIFSTTSLEGALNFLQKNLTKELKINKSMEEMLKSKFKGWELVGEIRSYVENSMNSYRVSPQYVGFTFRNPEEVWASNGGTEGEKAILLASLLKQAGFNAEVALGAYPHFLNKEVGCPSVFDQFLVKVTLNDETRYINAIQDQTPIPGARKMVAISDNISNLNTEAVVKPNLEMAMNANLEISKDGEISGNASVKFNEYDKEKGLLNGIQASNLKVKELPKVDGQTALEVDFSKALKPEKAGNYISYTFPCLSQGIVSAQLGDLPTERQSRLELPASFIETYEFTIIIPKGFVVVSPEYNELVNNACGSVMVRFEMENGNIKVTRKLNVNQAVVPVESYKAFSELLSIWTDKNLNRLIVKSE